METNVKTKDACEWLRVSTKRQTYAGGIETARKITLEIAKRFELNMRWSIDLPGISGTRVMLTRQIKELVRLITVEGCRHIAVKETSRLMRPERYIDYQILDVFRDNNVTLYTPDKAWDFSSPDERMMFQICISMAGRERELIQSRTTIKREELRTDGLCASGSNTLGLCIGYDRKAKDYFPKPEADQAKQLFELFTSGMTSFRQLALKTGVNPWRIPKILENTSYIGIRTYTYRAGESVYNDDDTLSYQKMVKREAPLVTKMAGFTAEPFLYPTIVTEDMFQQAQRLLAVKREQDIRGSRKNNEEDDPFLFRGFLRCDCGGNIMCLLRSTGRNYYCCINALAGVKRVSGYQDKTCDSYCMRAERADVALELLVTEKIGNPKFIRELLNNRRNEQDTEDVKKRADTIRRQIDVTHAKMEH
jgi:DNA invertase Pin-like site-specific DNA recombinase